ncbi:MAG: hypothetical protein QW783_03910, partial [Candidatus Micrarchaeia archaeon]
MDAKRIILLSLIVLLGLVFLSGCTSTKKCALDSDCGSWQICNNSKCIAAAGFCDSNNDCATHEQ